MRIRNLICFSLVLAMASIANATLSMTLSTYDDVDIGVPVVVTISSNAAEEITWGVYLDPTTVYPADAGLQNPTMLAAAGNKADVTAGLVPGPDAGHDYMSDGNPGGPITSGDWSTVEFVGLTVGTYTIDLYQPAGGAQLATADITVVPEPATIALLGLGGLALLRRRKH